MTKKLTCKACKYCFMEPNNMNFICGHPDAGTFGLYIYRAASVEGHCGLSLSKFEQHPLRNEDGSFKSNNK